MKKIWDFLALKGEKVELQSNITSQRKSCFNFKFLHHPSPLFAHIKILNEDLFTLLSIDLIQAIPVRGGGWLLFRSPMTIREPGTDYPAWNTRMALLVAFDSEVISSLLHLWLSFKLHLWLLSLLHLWSNLLHFIVGGFITFVVKSYIQSYTFMVSITFTSMVNFYYIHGWHLWVIHWTPDRLDFRCFL